MIQSITTVGLADAVRMAKSAKPEAGMKALALADYEANNRCPVDEKSTESAEQNAEYHEEKIQHLRRQQRQTNPLSIKETADTEFPSSIADRCFGIVALSVAFCVLLTFPSILAVLFFQSQKIDLLVSYPVIAALLGIPAVAGTIGSINIRRLIRTDQSCRIYDLSQSAGVAIIALGMVTVLAVEAYPASHQSAISIWESAAPSATERVAVETPTFPPWLSFVIGGLLELFAGPVCHQYAQNTLTPRRRIARDDGVHTHLDGMIKKALADCGQANDELLARRQSLNEWHAGREQAIQRGLGLLQEAQTMLANARAQAEHNVLLDTERESLTPSTSTAFKTSTLPHAPNGSAN